MAGTIGALLLGVVLGTVLDGRAGAGPSPQIPELQQQVARLQAELAKQQQLRLQADQQARTARRQASAAKQQSADTKAQIADCAVALLQAQEVSIDLRGAMATPVGDPRHTDRLHHALDEANKLDDLLRSCRQ